jgi:hypothetical protein
MKKYLVEGEVGIEVLCDHQDVYEDTNMILNSVLHHHT